MEDSQRLGGRDRPVLSLALGLGLSRHWPVRPHKGWLWMSHRLCRSDKSFQCVSAGGSQRGQNPTFLRGPRMKLSPVSPVSCQQWVGQTERTNSKLPCHSATDEPLKPVLLCQRPKAYPLFALCFTDSGSAFLGLPPPNSHPSLTLSQNRWAHLAVTWHGAPPIPL